jgi:hypothetical protein
MKLSIVLVLIAVMIAAINCCNIDTVFLLAARMLAG